MAVYKEDIVRIDTKKTSIQRNSGMKIICMGDNLADKIGVSLYSGNTPVDLSGATCTGYFIRPDGGTVSIVGSVSGNTAYVILPNACYIYEGQFALAIKIAQGGSTDTMRVVDGYVRKTTTDDLIDPGTILPSVESLINAINSAVATIPPDYSALTNEVGDIKDAIFNDSYAENIEHETVEGSYVNSVGEFSESPAYTRTDYIRINQYASLQCDKDAMYCFWNESKTTFLGRYTVSANVEGSIPTGAVYAILENLTTTFADAKIFGTKTSPIKEITDGLGLVKHTADTDHSVLKVGIISGKNLYNKNATDNIGSKSIYYLTGAEIDNNNVDASGYIEVFEELGEYIIVSGYTGGYAGGGVGMACFDANKDFIRGSNTNIMSIKNAKYVRLSIGKLDQNTFQCEYGVVATEYEPYTSSVDSVRLYLLEKDPSKEQSRWKGKKVLVLGDSISTDAYLGYASWATQWANNTGAILINPSVHAVGYLCGVGSATPNANSLINLIDSLHETYPNNDDFDLIVFFRGTNDFGNSVLIGNSGDTKDASFTGAVEYCHRKAWEYWCKAQIVVFTPMQRRTEQAPNLVGETLRPYANIVKEKAEYMGFPVLDLYHNSGFLPIKNPFGSYESGNSDFCIQYTMIADGNPDGLHPNQLFTTSRLVPTITKFLDQI